MAVGTVGVGAIQAGYGASRGDWVFTALRALYALPGVGFLRIEVYAADR